MFFNIAGDIYRKYPPSMAKNRTRSSKKSGTTKRPEPAGEQQSQSSNGRSETLPRDGRAGGESPEGGSDSRRGELEKRIAARFQTRAELRAAISTSNRTLVSHPGVPCDISTCGTRVITKSHVALQTGEIVEIQYFGGNNRHLTSAIRAVIVGNSPGADDTMSVVHMRFVEQQRLEEARSLVYDHAKLVEQDREFRRHDRRLTRLASTECAQINQDVRDLKGRLFLLVLTSLTLVCGLAGLFVTLHGQQAAGAYIPNTLLVSIAVAPLLLGLCFGALFIQKMAEMRRYTAFLMILQRYLAIGKMPLGYRGWEDAYANYTALWDSGRIGTPERARPREWRRLFKLVLTWFPADSFYMLSAVFYLLIMPAGAVVALMYQFTPALREMEWWQNHLILFIMAGVLMFAYVRMSMEMWSLGFGKRSYDSCLVAFSMILHHGAPHDPYRSEPMKYVQLG